MTRLRSLCDIRDYHSGAAEHSNDAKSLGECFPDVSNDPNYFTLKAKHSKNIWVYLDISCTVCVFNCTVVVLNSFITCVCVFVCVCVCAFVYV
jgi:hypothetical protein